jgi:uncharacterized protein with GYD domain
MKKYLIKGIYNSEGIKGLIQEGGSGRRIAIEKMLEGLGGKIESFYYSLGADEVYVIVELSDDIAATVVGLAVNGAGLVKISISGLLSATDVDAASKKSVTYRAPGKS